MCLWLDIQQPLLFSVMWCFICWFGTQETFLMVTNVENSSYFFLFIFDEKIFEKHLFEM